MTLTWTQEGGWLETRVPIKRPLVATQAIITIEPRPRHCDRGRYIAKCSVDPTDGLPLDGQEGWPRYYFDLDRAKAEIEQWVAARMRRVI